MRWLLALFLAVVSSMAMAEANLFPALFDVSSVAADDVLNIRQNPTTSAAVIGELLPNATGVEVMMTDPGGTWGQINIGEQIGFVGMAFLKRQSGQNTITDLTPTLC